MKSTLVTDTSVVYAALDPRDRNHERCTELVIARGGMALPAPVITETAMLSRSRGNERAVDVLLGSVVDETVIVLDLEWQDYIRVRELCAQYADLPLSFVDAAIVAIAERLEETTIATLDRRHFSVVKPQHCEAFTLVP